MTHSPRAPKVGSRTRRGAAAVLLAVTAGVATLPATALAGTWGPKYSYYDGIKRVTGTGNMIRYSNRSRSIVSACDNYNEGWPVYGYTVFRQWADAAHSGTANVTNRSSSAVYNACSSGTWTVGWTNFFGYWVEAGACAEVGWPVPNNCVNPAYESHTP